MTRFVMTVVCWLPALMVAARADNLAIQPGQWKVTTSIVMNGAAAPPQVKLRCLTPEQAGEVVKRLRRDRPEPSFTISVRSHWDGKDVGMMKERVAGYGAAGVQHIMVHPQDREIDDWDTVIEGVGKVAAV